MLLRKQTRQAKLAYLSNSQEALTKFQRPPPTPAVEARSESDTDSEGHVFNRKVAVLPRIVRKSQENDNNIDKKQDESSSEN